MSYVEPSSGDLAETNRISQWKYIRALAPAILFWAILVGWLAYLLYSRAKIGPENDRANLREWLDETRIFRKTLPDLVREYIQLLDENHDSETVDRKAEEIKEQLRALADPIRMYQGQLPLFPEVYQLQILFRDVNRGVSEIVWNSPAPRPRQQNPNLLGYLKYGVVPGPNGDRATIRCDYRLHAYNKVQRDEEERQTVAWAAAGVVLGGSVLAIFSVSYFLRRERRKELHRLETARQLEHTENLMLAEKLRAQEAERLKEELDRKLLEQSLEAVKQESRAAEAEKSALQLKSQLYASIGIMAGSYAHNIKNLLVRPNDLLARCLETDELQTDQAVMLQEVRHTLGTVTERLQQILRTVRRDPNQAQMTQVDLNALLKDTAQTWTDMARDKWKLRITAEPYPEPLPVQGDLSHLQQAIENLLFNARDATFEMRNHVRDTAKHQSDPFTRKQALIDAAAWKGQVILRAYKDRNFVVLEVADNGIGMTEEVRQNCMQTHFSTKRDNALYQGYSAGMGLGLSFVVVVLEHHHAELEIESQPYQGALFRARFPLAKATLKES